MACALNESFTSVSSKSSWNLLEQFSSTKELDMYISIQSHESIFHLDGTYKTNFNNFPLVSFGRSNINRKYCLIFLSLVSKEETEDYIRLFEAFKYLCTAFNIN